MAVRTYLFDDGERARAHALMRLLGIQPENVVALDEHPMTVRVCHDGECMVRYEGIAAAKLPIDDIAFILRGLAPESVEPEAVIATGPANDGTGTDGKTPECPLKSMLRSWRRRSSRTRDA